MAPRTPASRMYRAKARAVAVRHDDRFRKAAMTLIAGSAVLALLLLLTTP